MSVKDTSKTSKLKGFLRKYRGYQGFLFILPALILLCIFCLYPTIMAFINSFTNWDGGSTADFIWFENYKNVFSDELFWISLRNAVILTVVGMVLGNVASIILAELMYCLRSKLMPAYRFLFVLPAMIPGIIVLLLWQKLVFSGSSSGLANTIISWFGGQPLEWFSSKDTWVVFLSIFLYGFPWVGGTSFLIYLAGLNGIDRSLIEASQIDGLSFWGRIFKIDLPLISGQLKYFLVMGFIGGLQNYSMQYAITNGGPGEVIDSMQSGTMVPGYYIYRLITGSSKTGAYGYACAMGVIMFIIIMVVTLVNNKLVKSEE
ncbi:MAG: sugar ABC transporter permease [Clostridia bacterium]|nr:sugar ABC transporter permease [Clostridia bacterium]MBR3875369.1 sugar ABC transporter permease [Clostridia bacterium]